MALKAKVEMIKEYGLEKLYEGVIARMLKDSRNKGSTRLTTDFLREQLTKEQWEELRDYVRRTHGATACTDLVTFYYPSESKDAFSKTEPAPLAKG